MTKPLHLFPPSDQFDRMFETERVRLEKLLGKKVQIEHMGSTAIPGLGGKGIIDIAIGVVRLSDLQPVANILISAGYFPDLDNQLPAGRIFLASREHDSVLGDYHLHIMVTGSGEWNDFIVFRDQLRSNQELRNEYMSLKNKLLIDTQADRGEHKRLKGSFIQKVLKKDL
jgi:GrpB-like predicted nucleotidyltransferase (UPF0157 family)